MTRRRIAFFAFVLACAAVLVLLPRRAAEVFFIALIVGSLAVGLGAAVWWWRKNFPTWRARLAFLFRKPIQLLTTQTPPQEARWRPPAWMARLLPLLMAAELAGVTWVALYASQEFWVNRPDQTLPGGEVEWQVNTAYMAHQGLREYGFIPLWNPWLEYGHPLIDNPQSFVLNPFSTAPSLLYGGVRGIKLGVVLAALLAGWGGWYLGYVLGLRTPGRLLLAVLLIGKGNMLAMFGTGYYQLATAQAYFPWIIGAAVAVLRADDRPLEKRKSKRGAVVLLAAALTLQFWGGSVWYSLPMLLGIGVLLLFYGFSFLGETPPPGPLPASREGEDSISPPSSTGRGLGWGKMRANWVALRRLALAGGLSIGLSAITLLPIWVNQDYIGEHPDDLKGGRVVDLWRVVDQFFNGGIEAYLDGRAPGAAQFYYSYIAPYWFVLLIFVLIPPFLGRGKKTVGGRWWAAALILIVICTLWGAGGNPVIVWMYRHLLLLGQWRFVGRALAVSSFLIGVLVAVRVDGIFEWLAGDHWLAWFAPLRPMIIRAAQGIFLAGMALACGLAAEQVIKQWFIWNGTVSVDIGQAEETCIAWLRDQHPHEELIVYRYGYQVVLSYINHKVRLHEIEADFEPLPRADTLSNAEVTRPLPAYGIAWTEGERRVLRDFGYTPIPDSPRPIDHNRCLWHKPNVPSYAYTIGLQELVNAVNPLTAAQTSPIENVDRRPGQVRLTAQGDPQKPIVVVVTELAYPGWRVKVNGERVRLESVGGLLGVILPAGHEAYDIEFAYRPPLVYWGGWVTLLTAFFCILYVVRMDERTRSLWSLRRSKPDK